MKLATILLQTILLASFATWFGGFGFYVSFVVPIGNDVLGSPFEQGLITRRATVPLNYLCGIAIIFMIGDSVATWKDSRSPRRQFQIGFAIMMLLMLAALFALHPQIDAFVDRDQHEIIGDYKQFYWLHRLYLWSSTFQWIAAWGWLFCYMLSVRDCRSSAGQGSSLRDVKYEDQ